jgi:hypothetical protein
MSSSGNITPFSSTKKHALNQKKAQFGAASSLSVVGTVRRERMRGKEEMKKWKKRSYDNTT